MSQSNIRGTLKELLAQKLQVNNVTLGAAELSVLTRVGDGTFATRAGSVKATTGKGKPAIIWELNPSANLSFGFAPPTSA